MVPVFSLWLPIVFSAVVVFVASSVLHMVLPWHKGDYKHLPDEENVRQALRSFSIPPGDYMTLCPGSSKEMKSPEFQEKVRQGPLAILTILPAGPINMGKNLLQWFIYCVVVGFCAAYVVGHLVAPGAEYRVVFRYIGAVTFMGYSLAQLQNSIWYSRSWGTTLRNVVDGLIYGLLTGGVFGWLWPN